VVCPIDC